MRLANTLVSYTLRRDSNDPWKSIEAVYAFKEVKRLRKLGCQLASVMHTLEKRKV